MSHLLQDTGFFLLLDSLEMARAVLDITRR